MAWCLHTFFLKKKAPASHIGRYLYHYEQVMHCSDVKSRHRLPSSSIVQVTASIDDALGPCCHICTRSRQAFGKVQGPNIKDAFWTCCHRKWPQEQLQSLGDRSDDGAWCQALFRQSLIRKRGPICKLLSCRR